MKQFLSPLITLLVFFSVQSGISQESEGFNPLGRDIPIEEMELQLRIQLEWIELSHETMTELLENEDSMKVDGRLSGNAGPLRTALKELIEDNDAQLLESAIVIARSGQRAKVESIAEYIYPTEYDGPGMILPPGETKATATQFRYLPQAAAFETRNLGVTVEVDPVLGADNRTVDLNLAPEIVYLVDEENYGDYESDAGEVSVVMPTIYTMKTTTQITTIGGEYSFLGAHSPFSDKTMRSDPERKVMLFVKVDIVHVGLPLPEKEKE